MKTSDDIDWDSDECHLLLNHRADNDAKSVAANILPSRNEFLGHIWLATSGSTTANRHSIRYVALSKKAICASAKSVNMHLNADKSDVWVNPLPTFHVGGLAVLARSLLCGMRVIHLDGKWHLNTYLETLSNNKATLSSLVPTQVYDIVCANAVAPPSLRAVVVGGGALAPTLYSKAASLGWKLLPSYGMTETASQIATAPLNWTQKDFPPLQLLSHLDLKIDDQKRFIISGNSLLTAYARIDGDHCIVEDPKIDGWFTANDLGARNGQFIEPWGRSDDFIKVSGENVEMGKLEAFLEELKLAKDCKEDIALMAVPDNRLGHKLVLAVAGKSNPTIEALVATFQCNVMPYEQIRDVHYLNQLPRSPLGKLLRGRLFDLIN